MMKKILYSLSLCLAFVFVSCEEETTQDTSKVTHFVEFDLEGDAITMLAKGTSFQEPGYNAILNGQDVASDVKITGNVNTGEIGIYDLTYSAINEDGFAKALTRTVYVYDPTPSVLESACYTVSKDSYRNLNGTIVPFGRDYSIVIYQIEPGIFAVTDFLGGWYDQRAGYGSDYAMVGEFQLNDDNTLEILSGDVEGWEDSYDSFENGTYDPVSGSLSWEVGYASSMVFYITLNK
ncbi:hypothetical protein EZS27_010868 [termite gut metagenome]|uniref:Pesticidal crystal protein Cry22Aa Ig-like domain-containing protein n=1 Tax=termite gut metagenome TaxID=433724 RepID=A0A5J4S7N1_9ZZZZ